MAFVLPIGFCAVASRRMGLFLLDACKDCLNCSVVDGDVFYLNVDWGAIAQIGDEVILDFEDEQYKIIVE